jgi:hypothetical protein
MLQWTVEEGPWAVMVVSLTTTAIQLHTRQLFKTGTYVAVTLPDEHGQAKANLLRVTQCEESSGATAWTVDGTFVKELPVEAVEAAQARIGAAGFKTLCRLVKVEEEGPLLVTMQNVSHRGIGVLADRPFDRGAYLKLEIPSSRPEQLAAKIVRVMHSARQSRVYEWLVGGVFLRGLTETALEVLL